MEPNMAVQYQKVQTQQFPPADLYQGPVVGHSIVTRKHNPVKYGNEGINLIRHPNATVTDNTQQYVNTESNTKLERTVEKFMNTAAAKAQLNSQLKKVKSSTQAFDPLKDRQDYSEVVDEGVKKIIHDIENKNLDDESD